MLYADALRGWDSTGIAAIKQNNLVTVVKDACPPASLFHRVQDHTWINNNAALVGHNRAATRGKTNKENAHPFKEEHITLVHNGTLRFHHHLKNVEVDSHAITHSIAEKGAKETLEILDGAYALVWYDTQTKLLYAARNHERPLNLIETDEMFILASETALAHWICSRNNIRVRKVQALTAGLIYSFKPNKKGIRYVDTSRFTPFEYKAPVKETINKKTGEVLSFPNHHIVPPKPTVENKVTSISPYKNNEYEGLSVGQSVDVLCYKKQDISYSAFGLGKHRWIADLPDHPDLAVEFYTDSNEDFAECIVNIRINRLYFSPGMKQQFLVGENPIIPQKKTADATGPIRTRNGIELTDQVLKLCESKYCEECTTDFQAGPDILLNPIVVNGHTYNYRYICADCADYLYIKGRKTK